MGRISVQYLKNMSFEASARNHKFTVDLPLALAGKNTGPTPTEFFITGLAACTGMELAFYCEKFGWDTTGLKVEAIYEISGDRIAKISLEIFLPAAKSEKERKQALGWAEKCLVHKSLKRAPEINITFSGGNDEPS